MPGKLTLVVTAGPIRGRRYEFADHDTFLFGRAPDCHAELAPSDTSASRHHFLLEVNPPAARLRDLGSLNGTHVNGVRYGGRQRDESPEEGLRRFYPEVDLRDGDQIRVGATVFGVAIEAPAHCVCCRRAIPEAERAAMAYLAGAFLCPDCRAGGREAGPREHDTSPGTLVGDYLIETPLGRGGSGVVFRARKRSDGRLVALKLMLPQVIVDASARDAFLREIEVHRTLRHPNIVELFDYGVDEDAFYFAMEYCPGGSAERKLRDADGPLDLGTAGRLVLEALEGLAFAHAAGFVHRDIKPDNLLLGGSGEAKVADFGLAKSFQQAGLSGMTATGSVAGTFFFMPREQITNFRLMRPASDVWSMGATLYYLLTGQYARDFELHPDPLAVILRGGVVPIRKREPRIPEAVAEVIDCAVADDVKDRYPSAAEFREALRRAVD